MRGLVFCLLLVTFVPLISAVWVAQRYDYPKSNTIEVAKFGLERGGRYQIDIAFSALYAIPLSALREYSVRFALNLDTHVQFIYVSFGTSSI